MTTRPALGPCVSFKLDEDTHLKLVNAKERSGRSKAGEVVLRVKDHLLRYPDFYPTVTYKSVSFGPVVMARFDEDTNKKLIAAKNKSNRSKSHEVYLRLKEGANKQVISSQADSLIKISRIWADFFPANTSNQPI
ncbi:TraY domain-containing protein [Klebsiella pneumoniae]|uniref:TraY domain-containing protein n=1 Tax=Klebsiella pneumoniae TaxID=573 RepID=UPI0009082F29|nr:TraY domain-containing protein [Klebsiella pneumoniae]